MPVIAEEPELGLDMNELIETPSMSLDNADDTLASASAPAASGALDKQAYVCPAHPDIDK